MTGATVRDEASLGCLILALVALGAGLVETAVGAGTRVVPGTAFVAWGLAHLAWAVWLLYRGRIVGAGPALAVSLLAVLAWPALVVLAGKEVGWQDLLRPLPLLAIAVLNLAIAVTLVADLRRARSESVSAGVPAAHRRSAGAYFTCFVVVAAAVAALVTPALAATPAGDSAVPHGEHLILDIPGVHGH
ncbi:MAG: hypothetical protein JWQ68_1282 [Cryobacterium sp.]|jgi:hypothetical protein|nr:hypothetical protein [Cryobacterium sp.]